MITVRKRSQTKSLISSICFANFMNFEIGFLSSKSMFTAYYVSVLETELFCIQLTHDPEFFNDQIYPSIKRISYTDWTESVHSQWKVSQFETFVHDIQCKFKQISWTCYMNRDTIRKINYSDSNSNLLFRNIP